MLSCQDVLQNGEKNIPACCLQINGLGCQNFSMRHKPRRLEEESVVSRFWGTEHLRGRQKICVPWSPAVSNECFYRYSVLPQPFSQQEWRHYVWENNDYDFMLLWCRGVVGRRQMAIPSTSQSLNGKRILSNKQLFWTEILKDLFFITVVLLSCVSPHSIWKMKNCWRFILLYICHPLNVGTKFKV